VTLREEGGAYTYLRTLKVPAPRIPHDKEEKAYVKKLGRERFLII
jgi:hypothetical protein